MGKSDVGCGEGVREASSGERKEGYAACVLVGEERCATVSAISRLLGHGTRAGRLAGLAGTYALDRCSSEEHECLIAKVECAHTHGKNDVAVASRERLWLEQEGIKQLPVSERIQESSAHPVWYPFHQPRTLLPGLIVGELQPLDKDV